VTDCCRSRCFPVLIDCRTPHPECPRSIPWTAIEPFAAIVERDYRMTLDLAARRGGFTPAELFKIMRREHVCHDGRCGDPCAGKAIAFVLGLVAGHPPCC
jgi:hypothetical protein